MSGRTTRTRRAHLACAFGTLALFLAAIFLIGCGGEPPRAPTFMRPLDEEHAASIIVRAFRELNIEPERNRIITFGADGKELRLDVAAKGRKFGIAYITRNDADKLGDAIPRRHDPDVLIVLRGVGNDEDARAVLLFSGDYMHDDLSGEAHTSTTIAAQRKLDLAARDVARKAERERWP